MWLVNFLVNSRLTVNQPPPYRGLVNKPPTFLDIPSLKFP
jgi:hypothetical protein